MKEHTSRGSCACRKAQLALTAQHFPLEVDPGKAPNNKIIFTKCAYKYLIHLFLWLEIHI